jgi:hypothetical protein
LEAGYFRNRKGLSIVTVQFRPLAYQFPSTERREARAMAVA